MKRPDFDPGLTQQFNGELRRAINKDGSFNVHRKGRRLRDWNPYLFLTDTTWPRFFFAVLLGFLTINCGFALLYVWIGLDSLASVDPAMAGFAKAFFFSVHTLTTVGYGDIYPKGFASNLVSALEAMAGLLGFALATGLMYGRFSRPTARIVFSGSMLIAPYGDQTSLQFRIANGRANVLMELEARVLFMTVANVEGQPKRDYKDLELERPKVQFLPLSWTIVHVIDEASPLYGKTDQDLKQLRAEFLILIKAFDDTFSQVVHARYSYRHDEVAWGAKFAPAFRIDRGGDLVLEVDRLNEWTQTQLPR